METAIEIIGKLKSSGFEAYLVGGAVRDFLLEKNPQDFDVATSAEPLQVKKLFSRTVDTGILHGTVLVLVNGTGVEVTTFRTEGKYTDHRRPDCVEFVKSLAEDLKRRDFTINAMAMTENLEIIDLFGGTIDLKKKWIRAVGEPDQRFQEDALRMLRAIRFAGQLNFSIEEHTLASIENNAALIGSIAVERVKSELDKTFASQYVLRSIHFLVLTGLADYLPYGKLFQTDWSGFEATGNPLSGWLYMLWRNSEDASVLSDYKLSNHEKMTLTKALEAARVKKWDSWTYYRFSEKQLELAAVLKKEKVDWCHRKKDLPIHSISDLAVSGHDLIAWADKKAGPWLKDMLCEIERRVVYRELENDKEKIKEWITDEYYRYK